MPKVPKDVAALLEKTVSQLDDIGAGYRVALGGSDLPDAVVVDIKNLLENQRSVLDYLAVHLRRKCVRGRRPPHKVGAPPSGQRKRRRRKVYFPIAYRRRDFVKWASETFPGLQGLNPELWKFLDSVQPYNQRQERALRDLRVLSNRKKHIGLVRQDRQELPLGQPIPPAFGPAVFRKADFGASPPDDGWIDFRFHGMTASALWVLGRIQLVVERIAEEVSRSL